MSYSSSATQISAGKKALAAYHNIMIDWYDSSFFSKPKYNISYEDLERIVSGRNENFLAELGSAVITAQIGMRRLNEAMERVVDRTPLSPLQVPSIMEFQKGITDEISEFDFSLLGDAGLDLAKVVAEKVEKVGETLDDVASGTLNTVSTISKILPVIVVGLVGIVLFTVFNISKNTKKVKDLKPL